MNLAPWEQPAGPSEAPIRGGTIVKAGDRVRLRPRRRADIMDMALEGKVARIETIEQDFEGRIHFAVTVDDDPGQDLGSEKFVGHRFFFRADEVEPLPANEGA